MGGDGGYVIWGGFVGKYGLIFFSVYIYIYMIKLNWFSNWKYEVFLLLV